MPLRGKSPEVVEDNMEKDSIPVTLASKEQIIKLYDLLELLNLKEDGIFKILGREKCENIEEVSYESMKMYIDSLTFNKNYFRDFV